MRLREGHCLLLLIDISILPQGNDLWHLVSGYRITVPGTLMSSTKAQRLISTVLFGFVFPRDTGSREASFVSSIQAAGITLAIARTCSAGNVTRFCSCDTSVHDENIEHNIKGKFDWGGCGDNFAKVRKAALPSVGTSSLICTYWSSCDSGCQRILNSLRRCFKFRSHGQLLSF